MRRTLGLGFLVAAMVLAIATPVLAHTLPSPPAVFTPPALTDTLTAAASHPPLPWAAIAAFLTMALAVVWRPRRALALGFVLVFGFFTFETGLHSTHHLGQANESRCIVAGVSAQLCVDLVDVTIDPLPARVPDTVVSAPVSSAVLTRLIGPDAGRAPPAPSV